MKVALTLISAPLMMAGSAFAQEAPPAQAQPPANAPAEVQPAGEVDDEEVARFALAALVMEQIAGSNSLAEEEQQSAMVNAVQQVGLEPQRFHEIAVASQTDTELMQRIQMAAEQHVEAAQQGQIPQAQ